MPSGAGHDAMHWAEVAPTGMIFIPCRDGISLMALLGFTTLFWVSGGLFILSALWIAFKLK